MKELILYALRRFCMLIPFLIGLTLVAFLLGVLSPGDPALALLTMDGTSEPTAEELDALRHAMGLDQPVWIQYGRWLMNALHGDLGVSYLTQKPVLDEILRRFPITFRLAVWAIGWVLVVGIPAGIWAAEKKDTAGEIVLRAGALFFISIPSFFLAILCMLLFSEEWRLLPSGGYGSMMQMIMPSFVLAAGTADVHDGGGRKGIHHDRTGERAAHAFYHEKTCTAQCPCPCHYDAGHFLRLYLGRIRHH